MRNPNWPLTFAGMRALGVYCLTVACRCGHRSIIDAGVFPDQLPVPAVRARLKCSICGARADEAHPAWTMLAPARSHHRGERLSPLRTRSVPVEHAQALESWPS